MSERLPPACGADSCAVTVAAAAAAGTTRARTEQRPAEQESTPATRYQAAWPAGHGQRRGRRERLRNGAATYQHPASGRTAGPGEGENLASGWRARDGVCARLYARRLMGASKAKPGSGIPWATRRLAPGAGGSLEGPDGRG